MANKRTNVHGKILSGLGHPVAYYPKLAHFLGDVKEALFLCQLIYWQDLGRSPDGWIFKTRNEWRKEVAFSRNEQERVRKHLRDKGYVNEEKRGRSLQLYYKFNQSKLQEDWMQWRINQEVDKREYDQGKAGKAPFGEVGLQLSTENTQENTRDYSAARNSLLKKMQI